MKILIAGTMGHIGSSVAKQLRSAYPEAMVVGLDTGYCAHRWTSAEFLPECAVISSILRM